MLRSMELQRAGHEVTEQQQGIHQRNSSTYDKIQESLFSPLSSLGLALENPVIGSKEMLPREAEVLSFST